MSPSMKWEDFFSSNFDIIGNLILVLLLIALDAFFHMIYQCPRYYKEGVVYSSMFLILPVVVLFILSLMFKRRCSRRTTRSSKYFCFEVLEAGKAPLLWILILIIDGKPFTCLMQAAFPDAYYYGTLENFKPYSQVAGLFGFTLYFLVIYFMTQHSCKSSFLSFWYRKRHEEHLLMDIEQILHNKLVEKRKNLVEELVSKDFDKVNPKEGGSLEKLAEMIRSYKDDVEKLLTEASDEKDIELVVQDS
ncbi:calcium homeostasis modulator protein 6-like isoform X1 [Spea bombifrons]|uniref:calcium homeostasis modulator protein 6-like isoform X1 n=1 Tax=Spea bombifrons TaxID=233779 RepID=UPI002349FA6D|nr:calcium homeostasis modulator protein 6-like isoform X1 [Spea bombifrons]